MLLNPSFLRFVWKDTETDYTKVYDDNCMELFQTGATLGDVYDAIKEDIDDTIKSYIVQIGWQVARPNPKHGDIHYRHIQLNLYPKMFDIVYLDQPYYFEYPSTKVPEDKKPLTYEDVLGMMTRFCRTGRVKHKKWYPRLYNIASDFYHDPTKISRYKEYISEWISHAMADYVYNRNDAEYYVDHITLDTIFDDGWGADWLDLDLDQDEACAILRILDKCDDFEGDSLSDFARESLYDYSTPSDRDRADNYYLELLCGHIE